MSVVELPFACRSDEGEGTHDHVVKKRAIQCALSRICGICGETLARPVAFVGTWDEADDGTFLFPPCHATCAEAAVRALGPLGAVLGQPTAPGGWAVVSTGGFDLVRPERRGEPVVFRPNSVIGVDLTSV